MADDPDCAATESTSRPRGDIAALLANREFLRAWLAGTLIGVSRWVEMLATGIFVIDLTGSATAVALVAFARMLPLGLLGGVAGTLAGRFQRRALLMAGTSIAAAVVLVLAGLAAAHAIAVWQIAIGSFVIGTLWACDFPIRRTLVADIAGDARVGKAMALESTTVHVTRLVGSGLGGLLIEAVGLDGAYGLIFVLLVVTVVLLAGLRRTDAPVPAARHNLLADTIGGLRDVAGRRYLLAALAVTMIFNFFGFSYAPMVPVIGRTVLEADALAIGLLVSTEAAASLTVVMILARWTPRNRLGAVYTFSVLAFLGAIFALAFAPDYWLALCVMLATGTAWGTFSVTQSTLILLASPPALRARAMGALVICIGVAPFGVLAQGWIADNLGVPTALASLAAIGAIAVVAVALLFPRLVKPGLPAPTET